MACPPIAGVVSHHDRPVQDPRCGMMRGRPLGEHQNDGLFRFHDFQSEVELPSEREISDVARRFRLAHSRAITTASLLTPHPRLGDVNFLCSARERSPVSGADFS